MANYKRRLLITLAAFAIWSAVAVWLSFRPHFAHVLGQHRSIFLVAGFALIAPIFFYPIIAEREPRLALGLTVLAAGLVLTAVSTVASLSFGLDNAWIDGIFNLGRALTALACLIFIWQGVRKWRADNRAAAKTVR